MRRVIFIWVVGVTTLQHTTGDPCGQLVLPCLLVMKAICCGCVLHGLYQLGVCPRAAAHVRIWAIVVSALGGSIGMCKLQPAALWWL
jgi:hypothetical protein